MDNLHQVSRDVSQIGSKGGSITRETCPENEWKLPIGYPSVFWGMILVVLGLLAVGTPQSAGAQTLDFQYNFFLANDCLNLTGGGSGRLAGTPLSTICTGASPGTSAGTSSGGGAGSAQSLSVSVENRRKDTLEKEEKRTTNGSSPEAVFNLGKGFSLFVTGEVEGLERDTTTFADGFDSTILGTTVGGDYLVNDQVLVGTAFNYSNTNGSFDGGGDFDTNSYGIILYGSVLPIPGGFVDVAGGYTKKIYQVARIASYEEGGTGVSISGVPSSNTDGNIFSVRVLAGYDHPIGNITVGPRVGVNYTNTDIDGYTEAGASGLELTYEGQSINSFQSVLGVQGSMAISTSYGVWVPQVNGNFIHEFENNQRFIKVHFAVDPLPLQFRFQTEKPVRNWANLSLGTVLVMPNGIQPFVNFRAMVGNDQFNNYEGTFGIRIEG